MLFSMKDQDVTATAFAVKSMTTGRDRTATNQALREAQTDERDTSYDQQFRKVLKDRLAAVLVMFDDENDEGQYVQKGISRAICYHADRQVAWYRGKLEAQSVRLRQMARRNDGSEVSTERLENTIAYTRRLENSMQLSASVLAAAEELHDELYAEAWKASSTKDDGMALSKCTTQAAREALLLSMQYQPAQKHLKRGNGADRTVDDRNYADID